MLSFLSITLLFVAVILSNCSTTDTTIAGPVITFANGVANTEIDFTTQVDPYTVPIVVTITAIGKIKTFTVTKKDGTGASSTITPTNSYSGETTYSETFTIICPSSAAFPLQIIFNVTDKNAQGMEKIYTITKKTVSAFAFTKNGLFYHIQGPSEGAYNLDGDAVVASTGTPSTKSMKNTYAAGVTFTGSWTSDAANGTQYVKLNSYDYTNANATSAATAFTAGTASASVASTAVNDIYIAKKSSTYYVIKITTLDPTFDPTGTASNKGKITFEYKKN